MMLLRIGMMSQKWHENYLFLGTNVLYLFVSSFICYRSLKYYFFFLITLNKFYANVSNPKASLVI